LEADLAGAIEQARKVFAEPKFQAFLPLLVRDLIRDRAKEGVSATYDSAAPSFRLLGEEYARLAESTGLRPEVDPSVIGEIIVGSHLMHLLSTGRPPTRATGKKMLDVLLNGLRQRGETTPS
jgi:hypothetical protein